MNTSNSTNTVEMNFFKSLARLLSSSFRNKPFKFWTNVFLFVLSVGVLIVIRTGNSFIPSLLSNETNQFINLCLDFASAFYVVGLIFYLYWKVSPIKKDLILSGVITFIIIGSITVALWLIPVYNGLRYLVLSQMELTLDEFGSFFASITGLLAFLAVLYTANIADKRAEETITLAQKEAESNRDRAVKAEEDTRLQAEEARQRYREDSERTIFFQLLDLHITKTSTIGSTNEKLAKYLENCIDRTEDYLYQYLTFTFLLNNADKILTGECITTASALQINPQEIFDKLSKIYDFRRDNVMTIKDGIKDRFNNMLTYEKKAYIDDKAANYLVTDLIPNKNELYKAMNFTANVIYKKFGSILGHYFRNMYYVMDTINNFSDQKNYKELFRAQLSRYELALGLFNAVSSNSSIKMIELLEEFDIFKDVYAEDLLLLKTAKEIGIEPSTLINDILNEYKNNINTQSATL